VPPGVVFFRDAETLQGNNDLTPAIVDGIRRTAILVPIVSRSYVTRPWCIQECQEFLKANAERGVDGRIFPVRWDDVSPADFQNLVGQKFGYEFFAQSADDKYADTLATDSDIFKVRMNTLRVEIGKKLEEMKAAAKPRAQAAAPAATPAAIKSPAEHERRPTVLIAAPPPGLGEQATRLGDYLTAFGCDVVRVSERFHELADYEQLFADDLAQAILFVQLLGRKFQPHPDDAIQSWDRWQYLAAEKAKLPMLRWRNKYDKDGKELDLAKLDADHRDFVTLGEVWD
jgi:hypothetical protein